MKDVPTAPITLTLTLNPDAQAQLVALLADVAAPAPLEVKPVLLDRNELARALGISTATVDRLARAGMPAIRLVDSKRYLLADVLVWLKTREQGA